MRILTLALALAAALPSQLAGQARYNLTFGATGGTRLLTDKIFQDIKVTQSIAPTVILGATLPVSTRERAGLEVGLGFGKTRIHEAGIAAYDGPSFRTLSVAFVVQGPLYRRFTYSGGAGLLKYLPDKEGIFLQGGPLLLMLGGGVDYHQPIRGSLALLARVRYDYQRFSTDQLRSIGFARTQDVHRVGVGLGLEYTRP